MYNFYDSLKSLSTSSITIHYLLISLPPATTPINQSQTWHLSIYYDYSYLYPPNYYYTTLLPTHNTSLTHHILNLAHYHLYTHPHYYLYTPPTTTFIPPPPLLPLYPPPPLLPLYPPPPLLPLYPPPPPLLPLYPRYHSITTPPLLPLYPRLPLHHHTPVFLGKLRSRRCRVRHHSISSDHDEIGDW